MEREELLAKHRKENKNLRAKIQAIKKGIPKGDKKRKKEVTTEIAILEQELEDRQRVELSHLEAATADKCCEGDLGEECGDGSEERGRGGGDKNASGGEMDGQGEAENNDGGGGGTGEVAKMSRAQKRKAKKAQLEREQAQRIAEGEAEEASRPSARQEEKERLAAILTPLGLAVRDITPDGHCLYAAVSDQISVKMKFKVSVSDLRKHCAEHILSNSAEFLPYLALSETGTQGELEQYCRDIAETAAWGGQPEIRSFSHIYKVPINVYQASAPVVCVGEEYRDKEALNLSYHLHEYGLGEHYNSVIPIDLLASEEK